MSGNVYLNKFTHTTVYGNLINSDNVSQATTANARFNGTLVVTGNSTLGNVTATTPDTADSSTAVATTAFCNAAFIKASQAIDFTKQITFNSFLPTSTITTTSSGSQFITKTIIDSLYTSLTATQSISGVKTFSSSPIVPLTPTTSAQAASKAYVDTAISGISTVSLSGTNAWTGTNSFNTNLPTSTQSVTSSTQLTTKSYVDTAISGISTVSLSGTNAWTGTNSFNTNLPTSTQSVTSASQLTTKSYVDTKAALLAAATNAFLGNCSFNSYLPTSTVTPAGATDLITKTFADTTYLASGGTAAVATNVVVGINNSSTATAGIAFALNTGGTAAGNYNLKTTPFLTFVPSSGLLTTKKIVADTINATDVTITGAFIAGSLLLNSLTVTGSLSATNVSATATSSAYDVTATNNVTASNNITASNEITGYILTSTNLTQTQWFTCANTASTTNLTVSSNTTSGDLTLLTGRINPHLSANIGITTATVAGFTVPLCGCNTQDGKYIYLIAGGGPYNLFGSNDYGKNLYLINATNLSQITCICCSSNGQYIYAANGGTTAQMKVSNNYGISFSSQTLGSNGFVSIACNDSGFAIAVSSTSIFWFTQNAGGYWNNMSTFSANPISQIAYNWGNYNFFFNGSPGRMTSFSIAYTASTIMYLNQTITLVNGSSYTLYGTNTNGISPFSPYPVITGTGAVLDKYTIPSNAFSATNIIFALTSNINTRTGSSTTTTLTVTATMTLQNAVVYFLIGAGIVTNTTVTGTGVASTTYTMSISQALTAVSIKFYPTSGSGNFTGIPAGSLQGYTDPLSNTTIFTNAPYANNTGLSCNNNTYSNTQSTNGISFSSDNGATWTNFASGNFVGSYIPPSVFPLYFYDTTQIIISLTGATYQTLAATTTCKYLGGSADGHYVYYADSSGLNALRNNLPLSFNGPAEFGGTLAVQNYLPFQASSIAVTPWTLKMPLYNTYMMMLTSAMTVNLPSINFSSSGLTVNFVRCSTTAIAITLVPASGNGIMDFAAASIVTTLTLATTVSSVVIMSVALNSTSFAYGWIVISKA